MAASIAKALVLEAMSLDEASDFVPALSKYLEAVVQFASTLLDQISGSTITDQPSAVQAVQSKTFGDQTKAALQCLERVLSLHQHFQQQQQQQQQFSESYLSPPVLALTPGLGLSTTTVATSTTTRNPNEEVATCQIPATVTKGTNVVASAFENNQRLIAQFRELIRKKQEQSGLSPLQIAQMETQLQKKITENIAVAEQFQRLTRIPPGSANTLPRAIGGRKANSSSDFTTTLTRTSTDENAGRKTPATNSGSKLGQWNTLGPYDTLAFGASVGEKWRSKSGDRRTNRHEDDDGKNRSSSVSSLPPLDESQLATILDDGDSDHEVPAPANGAFVPTIEECFGSDACSAMSDAQKQQQQVFIELIHTERSHVRSMKILQKLFYRPLARSNILPCNFVSYLPVTFLDLIFANLDIVVESHTEFCKAMKSILNERRIVDEIGLVLVEFFDGEFAENFKNAVAQYCQYQQFALEQLELRRRQDQSLAMILKLAESHPACNGFKLRDFLPIEMQRVSKYPLLFERLLKYADPNNVEEIDRLKKCYSNSLGVLARMNALKREFENAKKLAEIQSRLDTRPFYRLQHPIVEEYRRFNVSQHGFVFEGPLRLQKMDGSAVEMRGILCDEILLLLTKRGLAADERLRLQFHDDTVIVGAGRQMLLRYSPIIKLNQAKVKDAASSAKEFYILSTGKEVLLYHLMASNSESKSRWMKTIQKQIEDITKTQAAGGGGDEPTVASGESSLVNTVVVGETDEGLVHHHQSTTDSANSDEIKELQTPLEAEEDEYGADFADFSDTDEDEVVIDNSTADDDRKV